MGSRLCCLAATSVALLAACGGATTSGPAAAEPPSSPAPAVDLEDRAATAPSTETPSDQPAPEAASPPAGADAPSTSVPTKSKRGSLVVKYDDESASDNLQFEISVDGMKLSGVFVAAAGQSTTFSLPAGRIGFRQGTCNDEEEQVELAAGGSVMVRCWVDAKTGPCCQAEAEKR